MARDQLTPRDMAIIRRLICGETPAEVAEEMGISTSTLRNLQKDPTFASELNRVQELVMRNFIDTRADAQEILQMGSNDAAKLCVDAVRNEVDGTMVPLEWRLRSAWDVLNRTGHKAPERHVHMHLSPADLIAEAYKKRRKTELGPDYLRALNTLSNLTRAAKRNNGHMLLPAPLWYHPNVAEPEGTCVTPECKPDETEWKSYDPQPTYEWPI